MPETLSLGIGSSPETEVPQIQGDANKMIADRRGLAEATVKVHIKSILKKVRAANRTQAARWARQHLPMESPHPG